MLLLLLLLLSLITVNEFHSVIAGVSASTAAAAASQCEQVIQSQPKITNQSNADRLISWPPRLCGLGRAVSW